MRMVGWLPMSSKKKIAVGALMQHWHESMHDPIYAVGSFFYAGQDHRLSVVDAARSKFISMMDSPHPSWSKEERLELRNIRNFLDKHIAARIADRCSTFETCVRTKLDHFVSYQASREELTLRVFAELGTAEERDNHKYIGNVIANWVDNPKAAQVGFDFSSYEVSHLGRIDLIYQDIAKP